LQHQLEAEVIWRLVAWRHSVICGETTQNYQCRYNTLRCSSPAFPRTLCLKICSSLN